METLRDLWDGGLERAIIGAVLCGGKARHNLLARHVRASDFWLDGYDRLWRLMARMLVIDFLTVAQAVHAGDLARCGIDEVDLCRCINAWGFRSGALVADGFEIGGALTSPDDLAVQLARQAHGLATCRRAGARLQAILQRALGYDQTPVACGLYPKMGGVRT